MSAPDAVAMRGAISGIQIGACLIEIVELTARRGSTSEFVALAHARDIVLPAFGRVAASADQLALCVRPDRWLLLTPPSTAVPGAVHAGWQEAAAGVGVAIDLSSGFTALLLAGPRVREVLARSCRVDLDQQFFPAGHAAATIMAQVSVILAALPAGMLLLTPASTARHFREWLAAAAKPFGLMPQSLISVADLCRSDSG